MSRARPHYFPDDTPEPVAQPYCAIDELLDLIAVWLRAFGIGVLALVFLALFFPSVFNLFR
ncbi:hypothetical protein J2W35_003249 [Variovorax boronicumulans]|uniref:hypothetical protein n=1 Tax=Variovorax boronicumulans TaxID=436515 RepID=UPI0027883E97|nr:hypothetical protein [Variovorax boronicumulans]MDQ0082890.1 hypothetical protein [Variovorax boronicumulans]